MLEFMFTLNFLCRLPGKHLKYECPVNGGQKSRNNFYVIQLPRHLDTFDPCYNKQQHSNDAHQVQSLLYISYSHNMPENVSM